MPQLPAALSSPGLLLALCLVVGLVIAVNATLLSVYRRGTGDGEAWRWTQALGGARERQRQQTAQMEELHRAVNLLSAEKPKPDKSDE
jgi:hypothetical protein